MILVNACATCSSNKGSFPVNFTKLQGDQPVIELVRRKSILFAHFGVHLLHPKLLTGSHQPVSELVCLVNLTCVCPFLLFSTLSPQTTKKSWERAKISLKSVDASCRIDLSELSRMPLEVEMDDMNRGRTQKNTGEEVASRKLRKN